MSQIKQLSRPTSPFWIYRWRYTYLNTSVIHRYTAFVQCAGMLVLIYFLWALAAGPERYEQVRAMLGKPAFHWLFFIWLWSFFFHLLNGIRHLGFDAGYGFEKSTAKFTSKVVLLGATLLTLGSYTYLVMR